MELRTDVYRHKQSGDIFAIETDEAGHVRSTSSPLFSGDLHPAFLDYDEYWNSEIQAKLAHKTKAVSAFFMQ